MRRLALALVTLVTMLSVALLSGCGSSSTNAKLLEAHAWRVTKLGDTSYGGSADITTQFSAGKLSGGTGINRYSGTYEAKTANDISITLGPLTRVAGTPDAMQAESDFLKALGAATSYAADDQSLTLFDAGGQSVVTYAVEIPTPLVGTTWKMTACNNGTGGFQSAVPSSSVTATFAADGTLSGNAGINSYRAAYSVAGSAITIQPPTSTRMAGAPPLMAQESAYLNALRKSTTFEIEGASLMLRDSSGAATVGFTAE